MSCRTLTGLRCWAVLLLALCSTTAYAADPIRIGILGLDNYQVVEFAKFFNDPKAEGDLAGFRVMAGWPGGSREVEESLKVLPRWIEQIQRFHVAIAKTPEEVLNQSDVIILMSLDARQHLEQARWAIKAKKPLFIGRPLAASLTDAVRIVQEAEAAHVPIFSCSQHRFSPGFIGMHNHPDVGKILGADVYGGCPREPHHPDLYWHGIHGVETLYTMLGPGCESVTRASTDMADVVTGTWKDGRVGVYRGIRKGALKYSAVVFGDKGVSTSGIYGHGVPVKGVVPTHDKYMSYEAVAAQIGKFFKSKTPPMTNAELLEVYAFLEAAEESKRQNGAPVKLSTVLAKARAEAAQK